MKKNKKIVANPRVIKIKVPREIWDEHMSFWNIFRDKDILGEWMDMKLSEIKLKNK